MDIRETASILHICVTGGRGFVGSRLIAKCLSDGYSVINIARANVEQHLPCGKVRIISGNSDQDLKNIFTQFRFTAVVHLAASYRSDGFTWRELQYVNFTLPMTLASLCQDVLFINAGSYWEFSAEKGRPNCNYALSKRYFREFYSEAIPGINAINLILYGTFGGGDKRGKIHDQIIEAANQGAKIRLSEGYQKLNLVDIDDIVSAFQAGIRGELTTGTYGLFAPEEHSLRDIVDIVRRHKEIQVEWGAVSYRLSEVMKPAYPYPLPPNWAPKGSFAKYISSNINLNIDF